MIKMEKIGLEDMEDFGDFVPESLFEAIDQLNNGGKSCATNSSLNNSMEEFMDFELDLSSENMTSFLELEQEIKEATTSSLPEPLPRPSVIVRPRPKPAVLPSPNLADIMTSCGIEYDLPEDSNVSSPSSIHSDIQLDQNQELIEELEEFFIKTDGCPTVVDETEHTEQFNLSSSLVTPEGQNVIIIIAPSSPTESVLTTSDSDTEWTPSPAPLSPAQLSLLSSKPEQTKTRKKYARSKPPSPPSVAPYPVDKKERKKAQNRTAAFRYREKKKSEQDLAEEEVEALADKNSQLQEKLVEMETEFKYLKKLMVEAGLGKYTLAVNY
jgi:cyclic AMP-dependent transcription factor ATF-4